MAPSRLTNQGSESYIWDAEFAGPREEFCSRSENESFEQGLDREWKQLDEEGGIDEEEENVSDDNGVTEEEEDLDDDRYVEGQTVRNFIRCNAGGSRDPEFLDQAEKVEGFCEEASLVSLQSGSYGEDRKSVAFVVDRNKDGESSALGARESRMDDLTPLNHLELLKRLGGKRFRDGSPSPTFGDHPTADTRRIYVANLDPWSVLVLAKTASRLQVPVLRRMIYRHLTSRTALEVHVPPRGFKTFSFELSLSYCVLNRSGKQEPAKDKRLNWDRTGPLRRSWKIPHLQLNDPTISKSPREVYYMYEGEISISVSGIDRTRWTALAFVDGWFPGGENIDKYSREARPDPLAAGQTDVDPPERDPRTYFLKLFEFRIKRVKKEYDKILQAFQEELHRRTEGNTNLFPLADQDFSNYLVRKKFKALDAWYSEMAKIMGEVLRRLSATHIEYQVFQQSHIGYFLYDAQPSAGDRPFLRLRSLRIIEQEFRVLLTVQKKLKILTEALKELREELSKRLAIEDNNATLIQQKAGERVNLLTWVSIMWSPVLLATGFCSLPKATLPLNGNIGDFFSSLFVLATLLWLSVAGFLNWHALRNYVGSFMKQPINSIKNPAAQPTALPHFNSEVFWRWLYPSWRDNLATRKDSLNDVAEAVTEMRRPKSSYMMTVLRGDLGDKEASLGGENV